MTEQPYASNEEVSNDKRFPTRAELLGQACFVMMNSASHKYQFMADIEWQLVPAVNMGHIRLWRDKKGPNAFVTWAKVSDEVRDRLLTGNRRLRPADWNSGETTVVIDVIAPEGKHQNYVADLKYNVFKDEKLHVLNIKEDGKIELIELPMPELKEAPEEEQAAAS